ncbi:uncharacterized protein V1510DRAFT_363284 [Dipodascopsis tothii]|uniref:uncharacterized protein n=1 Tax=Dipodascopsis tothii TaxID=44089 RepID=UPI0034CD45A9
MSHVLPSLPVIKALAAHPPTKTAIVHNASGKTFTYGSLVADIAKWRAFLGGFKNPGTGRRIALMGENSYEFVACLLAIVTLENTIAIPLCTSHTAAELTYQLDDADCALLITTARFVDKLTPLAGGRDLLVIDQVFPTLPATETVAVSAPAVEGSGIILYTSGTSGNPKGVVITAATLLAQSQSLIRAWNIDAADVLLHTLPLHHIHGILNALLVPLTVGATVVFQFPFVAPAVLDLLAATDPAKPVITIYTAVPTIYARLATVYRGLPAERQAEVTAAVSKNLGLAMCGSAALPEPLRDGWHALSGGHPQLLERYGMTEVGMALSQPRAEADRVSGSVGKPLPGVRARLVDKDTGDVVYETVGWESEKFLTPVPTDGDAQLIGEIELAGPTVFTYYWNKPEPTASSFVTDDAGISWFKTGDIAGVDAAGRFWIKGRESMDIIKSGGEKISALEIEREILSLDGVAECAVVGLPNVEWGQAVAAVVVPTGTRELTLPTLKSELRLRLSGYKTPKELKVVEQIPRNQMGKGEWVWRSADRSQQEDAGSAALAGAVLIRRFLILQA